MRNERILFAIAIALAVISSVATAAPQKDKPHGTAPGVGQPVSVGAANGAAAADPLFMMLDTDGDGVISAKELHKAVAAIKEADTDQDGNITWAEIVARSGAIAAAANGQGEITSGMASGGGIGMGGDSQAMGRFMQYDKNHDGKVTVDEVPASMRDWDQNHDGVIDAREARNRRAHGWAIVAMRFLDAAWSGARMAPAKCRAAILPERRKERSKRSMGRFAARAF